MTPPSTLREAISGQLLGEVDELVKRIEVLQGRAILLDQRLDRTTTVLNDAADRFRLKVTAFSEEAKTDLTDHLNRSATVLLAQKTDEIHVAMQRAAKTAFEAQSWDTAGTLASRLKDAAGEFRRGKWSRLLENGVVALLACMLASAMTYGLTR